MRPEPSIPGNDCMYGQSILVTRWARLYMHKGNGGMPPIDAAYTFEL